MELESVRFFSDIVNKVCACCLSLKDLKSIKNPYFINGKVEIYSQMISKCFIDFIVDDGQICGECIERLRATINFKENIQKAQDYFKNYEKNQEEENDVSNLDTDIANDDYESNIDDDLNIDYKPNFKSSDEELSDSLIEPPPKIFVKETISIGERKTLPYVLDNRDRKCEICHKEFSFLGELSRHMPEHYPNHICDICGKICATRKSLMFHTKTHTDIRLKCKMCDKTFKNKSNLNIHVKVQHKGEKIMFKCSQCNEVLNTYNSRIKHMVEKHGREDKSYKCNQCSCKYRLGSHLRAHVRRVHLQEKNHKCHTCGLSFFSRKTLEHHFSSHTGEKNTCTVCQRSYSRKEALRQHMIKSHNESYVGC